MTDFNTRRTILFSGTTSSGSSALFDYFRCFANTLAVESELKNLVRGGFYKEWKSKNFTDSEKYKKYFIDYINNFLDTRYTKDRLNLTLFLNNVISCLTLRTLELLNSDILVFCVVRDPRSTWIRRKYLLSLENREIPVEEFIREFRKQRELFEHNYASLKKNKDKIIIVSFEDFMLDINYRNSLIEQAGFNVLDYPKKPKFSPWPIEQTILKHQTYAKQDEIELIYRKLEKYCNEKV